MSEFCTKCTLTMFGEQCQPDIDVKKEFEQLQEGFCTSGFICEGCGLISIAKIEGKLKVMRIKPDDDGENSENNGWEDYGLSDDI